MYNVSARVLESLKATLALQSKLSDTVTIFEGKTGIEFFTQNSSSTVTSRAFYSRHIFKNSIRKARTYCVSSIAFDRALSTIPTDFDEMTIEFKEKIHLEIMYKKIQRSHYIDLIDTPGVSRGPLEIECTNAFIIRLDMLREILTHFSPAAELVELLFDPGETVRWRGYRNPSRNKKSEIYTKIDSSAMMHYSDMFQGLHVTAPWRAEFRLRELRLAVALFDKICEDRNKEISCMFDESGAPLHLVGAGRMEAFCLKFDTSDKVRRSTESHEIKWGTANFHMVMDMPYNPPTQESVEMETKELELPMEAPPAKRRRIDDSLELSDRGSEYGDDNNALVYPMAEIESTQQERVPGLFD